MFVIWVSQICIWLLQLSERNNLYSYIFIKLYIKEK